MPPVDPASAPKKSPAKRAPKPKAPPPSGVIPFPKGKAEKAHFHALREEAFAALKKPGAVLALLVKLSEVHVPVWRLLHVSADTKLKELHLMIQAAFGWQNYHMFEFEDGEIWYQENKDDDFGGLFEKRKTKSLNTTLAVALANGGINYRYDFGDDWFHEVWLLAALPSETPTPACAAGAGAGLPEDCGGPPGYENLCAALADKNHPDHADLLDWYGEEYLDPHRFDLEAAHAAVAACARKKSRAPAALKKKR